ncbi:MAG: GatB/YqeY domain-containing protein [Propionibacteriaceae bacterium]|jgi:uncharacterized protein YqeY|nr:GatB/YqeY domain-containing protein [Propionibacteriaceae bacterium]
MDTRFALLTAALRGELKRALRARDAAAIAALRSLMSALDNACAQPADAARGDGAPSATSVHVAGAVVGVGTSDVPRRELDDEVVDAILAREIGQRRDQAAAFDRAGRDREAAMAQYQAKLLSRFQ